MPKIAIYSEGSLSFTKFIEKSSFLYEKPVNPTRFHEF
jgi:hypothetical protein